MNSQILHRLPERFRNRWWLTLTPLSPGVLTLVLFTVLTVLPAEPIPVLLQKGIFAEETEGDLDAAITIYREIIAQSKVNQSLVGQAQYRLGMCLLKKGQNQPAVRAFREIVDRFPAQVDLVALARTRLSELGQPSSGVVVKQVWSPDPTGGSGWILWWLSPDGRQVAWIDRDLGSDIELRDLETGISRKLVLRDARKNEWPVQCAFSRDGRRIAYSWYVTNDHLDLRVVDVEGRTQHIITGKPPCMFLAEDWSPDGKSIAVVAADSTIRPAEFRIAVVSVADGSEQAVCTERGQLPGTLRWSADGRHLAYNSAPHDPRMTNDIVVVDLETRLRRVVSQPGHNEKFVGWAPGGSRMVFTSTRRSSVDLWMVDVQGGSATGEPRLLNSSWNDFTPHGLSRDGTLCYSTSVELKDLHLATMDLDSGKWKKAPQLVRTPFAGSNDKPILSPDRRYLFYRSGQKEPRAYRLDLETWDQREIPGSAAWASRIGWWWVAPDLTNAMVQLYGSLTERQGYYGLDCERGTVTPLVLDTDDFRHTAIGSPAFDGKTAFLFRHYPDPKPSSVIKYDITLGREIEYEAPAGPGSWRSVDGPWLLRDGRTFLYNRKKESGDGYLLVSHDLESREEKVLYEAVSPMHFQKNPTTDEVSLSFNDAEKRRVVKFFSFENLALRETLSATLPDGFRAIWGLWHGPTVLLEPEAAQGGSTPREVWTFGVRSGALKRTELTLAAHQTIGWLGEDGRLLLRTMGPRRQELWAMENLFPATAPASTHAGPERLAQTNADRWQTLSPDGRRAAYFESYPDRGLVIEDLGTGESSKVGNGEGNPRAAPVFSPDGMRVAYYWRTLDDRREIRVAAAGHTNFTVLGRPKGAVSLLDWSPDGSELLGIETMGEYESFEMIRISAGDGATRTVPLDYSARELDRIKVALFTSEGRHIVLQGTKGIEAFDLETKNRRTLIDHPAWTKLVGRIGGTSKFLFAGERSGKRALYAFEVLGGQMKEEPREIMPYQEREFLGAAADGSFFYRVRHESRSIHVASVDFETGKVMDPPREVGWPVAGDKFTPVWSWDGKRLAWQSQGGTFVIQDQESQTHRGFTWTGKLRGPAIYPYRAWSPDEKTFLVLSFPVEGSPGIYSMDCENGEIRPVVTRKWSGGDGAWVGQPQFSSDGRSFVFYRRIFSEDAPYVSQGHRLADRILRRNLESGVEEEVFVPKGVLNTYCAFAISPDETRLALVMEETENDFHIDVVDLRTGGLRRLYDCSIRGGGPVSSLSWTPNGEALVFLRYYSDAEMDRAVLSLNVNTGKVVPIALGMTGSVDHLSLHPDGRQIVFGVRQDQTETFRQNLMSRLAPPE